MTEETSLPSSRASSGGQIDDAFEVDDELRSIKQGEEVKYDDHQGIFDKGGADAADGAGVGKGFFRQFGGIERGQKVADERF
jgi:hypothetical protein